MKALARSYVWWPNMDSDIELTVSACSTCHSMRSNPSPVQIHPWTFPARPWSRIHVDFAGPISGYTYLVVVDAYSKFPEVVKMSTTSAKATVTTLRDIFSRHGLPEIIVSQNGPQFTATEFEQFCTSNGILHRISALYKPSTNGQAERVVQILKSTEPVKCHPNLHSYFQFSRLFSLLFSRLCGLRHCGLVWSMQKWRRLSRQTVLLNR